MIAFSVPEAQLFRLLVEFFGQDHVIPQMSVVAVCGGVLPNGSGENQQLVEWAKQSKCLFTIVDQHDSPCMVVEFFAGFECSIDVQEEAHQRLLPPLLKAVGVRYVTISPKEFSEMLDPASALDMFTLLKAKLDQEGAPASESI
jgi:hypothetical protein